MDLFLGKNIRYFRKKRNLSQLDLAQHFGYQNQTTVAKWESGKADPPIKMTQALADFFGVNLDDFVSRDIENDPSYQLQKAKNIIQRVNSTLDELSQKGYNVSQFVPDNSFELNIGYSKKECSNGVTIPVVNVVAAGIPIESEENIIDTEEISQEMARRGDYFALKINGDSMEPYIFNEDIVIVRKQPDAESGDTVVALVNGSEGCCKRLMKFDFGIQLISYNQKYEPMVFSNEQIESMPVTIVGKVVESRRKF